MTTSMDQRRGKHAQPQKSVILFSCCFAGFGTKGSLTNRLPIPYNSNFFQHESSNKCWCPKGFSPLKCTKMHLQLDLCLRPIWSAAGPLWAHDATPGTPSSAVGRDHHSHSRRSSTSQFMSTFVTLTVGASTCYPSTSNMLAQSIVAVNEHLYLQHESSVTQTETRTFKEQSKSFLMWYSYYYPLIIFRRNGWFTEEYAVHGIYSGISARMWLSGFRLAVAPCSVRRAGEILCFFLVCVSTVNNCKQAGRRYSGYKELRAIDWGSSMWAYLPSSTVQRIVALNILTSTFNFTCSLCLVLSCIYRLTV